MLREGTGEPLVLLHGVMGSERMWRTVAAGLAPHHDVIVPTAMGHRGGREPIARPLRRSHLLDDAERTLDELGFDKVHLVGNSLGGWMALELATRGRGLTVTAFSPAGTWDAASEDHKQGRARLKAVAARARRGRPFLPLVARIGAVRREALKLNAVHGERVSAADLISLTDDVIGCTGVPDLLETPEGLERIDPPPCPITIAWSREDRVLPLATNGERAKELVPGARFIVLEDVGHVPMFDDPALVVRTVLETTAAAGGAAAAGPGPGPGPAPITPAP
jgi:pimeloyl-ACP methyl ester carboxylesterase